MGLRTTFKTNTAFGESVSVILLKHGGWDQPSNLRRISSKIGLPSSVILLMRVGCVPSSPDQIRQFADKLGERRVPLLEAAGLRAFKEDRDHDEAVVD